MSIRVRHVPAGHPYVEALLPASPDASGAAPAVVHPPDPPVPGAPPGQWWPHPALEPAWVREHAGEQDVVHVHFGMEGRTLGQLREWRQTLREVGLPLVHTVHDIDHPQLHDQTRHRAHLGLLAEEADGLLTLTEGAADAVERAHGRRPLVMPHPHVVPLDLVGRERPTGDGRLRVGLHLKSVRPNLAPVRVLPALAEAVRQVDAALSGGAVLQVRVHPEVTRGPDPRGGPALTALLAHLEAHGAPEVEVVTGPRLSDAELWDHLGGLDVSVLPYAWGTHSGWLEACRDLGTWVLAPDVGHLREQGGVLTWGDPRRAPRPARLVELLQQAAAGPPPRVTRQDRERQRSVGAVRHAVVYAAVLDGRRVDARTEDLG